MSATIMKPKRIVIHCTATPNRKEYPLENLRRDHKARGFSDIGYHMIIQPNGQVDNGRPLNQVGAHVEGHNTGSIGIALVGTDKFTRRQFDALRYKLDALFLTFQLERHEIWAHCQFDTAIKQGKTCPEIPINVILLWYYQICSEQVLAPYLIEEI